MKIADNSLPAIRQYFTNQLSEIYENGEIRRFYELTLEHFFGLTTQDLIIDRERRLTESEMLRVISVVKGLKLEVPIQYLLGKADFFGLELVVNHHVLIPRQETEELVDWIINTIPADRENISILDVGTGSGCIALALKSAIPAAHITAIDVSAEALAVARMNADRLNLLVIFQQMNVLEGMDLEGKFDLIVSNPPYVTRSERRSMRNNVIHHEPHLALFVDDNDPLLFYRTIGKEAQQLLKKGGWLFFEINESFGNACVLLLEELGYTRVGLRKDLNSKNRMVRCRK